MSVVVTHTLLEGATINTRVFSSQYVLEIIVQVSQPDEVMKLSHCCIKNADFDRLIYELSSNQESNTCPYHRLVKSIFKPQNQDSVGKQKNWCFSERG